MPQKAEPVVETNPLPLSVCQSSLSFERYEVVSHLRVLGACPAVRPAVCPAVRPAVCQTQPPKNCRMSCGFGPLARHIPLPQFRDSKIEKPRCACQFHASATFQDSKDAKIPKMPRFQRCQDSEAPKASWGRRNGGHCGHCGHCGHLRSFAVIAVIAVIAGPEPLGTFRDL